MADGPNHEQNFQRLILRPDNNLTDIVRFLRFYKSEGPYQGLLAHYLPLLAEPAYKDSFNEFVTDYEDKDKREELKKKIKPEAPKVEVKKPEVKVEAKPEVKVEKPKK